VNGEQIFLVASPDHRLANTGWLPAKAGNAVQLELLEQPPLGDSSTLLKITEKYPKQPWSNEVDPSLGKATNRCFRDTLA